MTLQRFFSSRHRLWILAVLTLAGLLTGVRFAWVGGLNLPNAESPTISLNPTSTYPGSFVQVIGTGFYPGDSYCGISSSTLGLFESPPECFTGAHGNITGIFQVSGNAKPAAYTINVTYQLKYGYYNVTQLNQLTPQYASAVLQIISPPVETVTEPPPNNSPTSLLQIAVAASAGVAVSSVAAGISLRGKNADIRGLKRALDQCQETAKNLAKPKQTPKRPDFGAFTIDVKSGIERKEAQA